MAAHSLYAAAFATNVTSARRRSQTPRPPTATAVSFSSSSSSSSSARRRRRQSRVVVRAGPPSTNSLILVFVLPLSLLVGTIFTAIRIDDRLEEKYLEELAMNEAIMQEKQALELEEDGDEYYEEDVKEGEAPEPVGDGKILVEAEEEMAAAPARRARNRPRREA